MSAMFHREQQGRWEGSEEPLQIKVTSSLHTSDHYLSVPGLPLYTLEIITLPVAASFVRYWPGGWVLGQP